MKLDLDHSKENTARVDVLCLMPGFVNTPLVSNIKNKWLEIQPSECARSALNCLGKVNMTFGHWKHVYVGTYSTLSGLFYCIERYEGLDSLNNQWIRIGMCLPNS